MAQCRPPVTFVRLEFLQNLLLTADSLENITYDKEMLTVHP